MTTKQQLRREIEAQRIELKPQWLEAASARIAANFQDLEAFPSAKIIALYMSLPGEVELDALFELCWNLGKHTCIPVFDASSNIYKMAEISTESQFKIGNYGIREPISPILTPMNNIDLIAVPGVAFDRNGNRLGRGGGYYDRLLDGFPGVAAAVAFEFQVLSHIPCEAHDKPVNAIVTEIKSFNVL